MIRLVFANPVNHGPRWMLAAGVEHRPSRAGSSWKETVTPRAEVVSPRVYTSGTVTHGCAVEMASPAGLAATNELGGAL